MPREHGLFGFPGPRIRVSRFRVIVVTALCNRLHGSFCPDSSVQLRMNNLGEDVGGPAPDGSWITKGLGCRASELETWDGNGGTICWDRTRSDGAELAACNHSGSDTRCWALDPSLERQVTELWPVMK
ncbi:hypothetical protein LY78DRAFT_50039 [Colletotrichum sublineola]|nr:hypothetical protein LY78DRAFT_50039 [Colletotrichum sublineola]